MSASLMTLFQTSMGKHRMASEGTGHRRNMSSSGRTSRRFTNGRSLLPLTLGRPANQGVAPEVANAPRIATEAGKGHLAVENGMMTNAESKVQEENEKSPSPQRALLNIDQGIKHVHLNQANLSRDPMKNNQRQKEARMRKRLRLEIEAYVAETYLSEVYGDFLFGHRTRLYEPSWPPSSEPVRPSSPPHLPKSREEADAVLQKITAPLVDWYSLPDSRADKEEARQMQSKIAKALDRHERERGARECRQKVQGSSCNTLYRNAPDAALEANVLLLVNRCHLAVQCGEHELADRLIDRALGTVDGLDYRPLNAKCWYWKGLIADKVGNARETAEAFFNALECVGKYEEGTYLPKFIQVYEQEILEMLQIDDETGKMEMARKLERAAKGLEPFHFPSPEPAQYERPGLALTPPRMRSPSIAKTSRDGERVIEEGHDILPRSEETGRSELRGLNINIPLPCPSDVSQARRRSTASTPISPKPTSPLKPVPAHRSSVPKEPSASTPEQRNVSRPTSSGDSTIASRPGSSSWTPALKPRPQSRVLGVIGDIEWHEMVQKQAAERAGKIHAKKEKYPYMSMRVIRNSIQTCELHDLRKRFGDDIPNPHVEDWESARSKTPSPKERQLNAMKEESNNRLSRIYDHRDSAVKSRLAWRKKAEEDAKQAGRGVLWDPDDIWSRDEETLRKEGLFDRPAPRTAEDDRRRRKEERMTLGRLPQKGFLEALRHIHTPGEEDRAKKSQTLFMPLAERRRAAAQRPVTMMQDPTRSRLQPIVSQEAAMLLRRIDTRSSELPSPSPSPLRSSSVPDEGREEEEEEGDRLVEGAESRRDDSDRIVGHGGEHASSGRSLTWRALTHNPPNPPTEQKNTPDTPEMRQGHGFRDLGGPTFLSSANKEDTERTKRKSRRKGGFFGAPGF